MKHPDPNMVPLYDRNRNICGHAPVSTRCWCTHTLGQHYSAHCVEGCPCGGSYPPRLPEGKQGFSQAMHQSLTTCIRCDAETANHEMLCDTCRKKLQAKVDRAAKEVEFEMVNGTFQKKRPWYKPDAGDLGRFALGAFAMVIIHALGWWP